MALVATSNGALIIDSVLVAVNDRVLINNETLAENNGIYTVEDAGSPTTPWVLKRALDMDTSAETLQGCFFKVTTGATNTGRYFRLTTLAPILLDITPLTFTAIPQMITVKETP